MLTPKERNEIESWDDKPLTERSLWISDYLADFGHRLECGMPLERSPDDPLMTDPRRFRSSPAFGPSATGSQPRRRRSFDQS